jgi:hypothetical protein
MSNNVNSLAANETKTDLSRLWPDDSRPREAKIASFAKLNGWRLRFYKEGLCAIFDKDPVAD